MLSIAQGLVALRLEVGLLYPLMGYAVGSILQKKAAHVSPPVRQRSAVVFAYLAIALSPLIPFGNAVGFEPVRMRNTAVGLVLVFVPQMLKTGGIGLVNTALLILALRQAWGQARAVPSEPALPDRAPAEMQADQQ
jgi:hypothetical protein